MEFTGSQLMFIGGLAVVIVGIVARQWFTKTLNQKFDDLHAYFPNAQTADDIRAAILKLLENEKSHSEMEARNDEAR